MDILTIIIGVCLVILCITSVETMLWSYTVFNHCRWSVAHDVPDRRSISYNALAIFSGIVGVFCFLSWLGFVYIVSFALHHIICVALMALILAGFHIIICHIWHLVSSYTSIPLEYVPFTSRFFIRLSNRLFTKGYTVTSLPLHLWEEFYAKAKEHKSLLVNFIDKSPDMFWTKDEYGRYTYTNDATNRDLLLTSHNDAMNRTNKEIAEELKNRGIDYTFADNCIDTDNYTRERRKPTLFYEYGIVDGKFLALRVLKAPIFDVDSNMVGIIGVGRNVTHHIEAYNEIEELFNAGKPDEARNVFLAYKQTFENMRDIKDPEGLIRGMR